MAKECLRVNANHKLLPACVVLILKYNSLGRFVLNPRDLHLCLIPPIPAL